MTNSQPYITKSSLPRDITKEMNMAYDPYAVTESQRSFAYKIAWPGLIASIVFVALIFFETAKPASFISAAVAGSMMIAAFNSNVDDYYDQLRMSGFRFAMAVLTAWLLLYTFIAIGGIANSLGFSLGSGQLIAPKGSEMPHGILTSAHFIVGCTAIAYHAGFLFARYRK